MPSEKIEQLLMQFSGELLAWLKDGGDARLIDFDPLTTWNDIVKEMSRIEKHRRGFTQ